MGAFLTEEEKYRSKVDKLEDRLYKMEQIIGVTLMSSKLRDNPSREEFFKALKEHFRTFKD